MLLNKVIYWRWIAAMISIILAAFVSNSAMAADKPRVKIFPIIKSDPLHPESLRQVLQMTIQNYETFPVFCPSISIYVSIYAGGQNVGEYPVVILDLRLAARQKLVGRDESAQLKSYLNEYPNYQISSIHLETAEIDCKQSMIGHYQDNGDGTVTDTTTKLMWKRCSEGQTWTGSTCAGEAIGITRNDAMPNAQQKSWAYFAGYSDWRVPNREELKSLVYCSSGKLKTYYDNSNLCEGEYQRPTINQAAFPNTPASWFWTASRTAADSDYSPSYSWFVDFDNGYVYHDDRNHDNPARLVRSGQ